MVLILKLVYLAAIGLWTAVCLFFYETGRHLMVVATILAFVNLFIFSRSIEDKVFYVSLALFVTGLLMQYFLPQTGRW